MRTRRLGRTDIELTVLGFGAAPIGNLYREIDDDTALAAVEAAWAGGVRYFDTAPHYGLGLSERRLGRALLGRPRDEFVVSTKVGRLLVPNPTPVGSDLGAGGFAVRDDLIRERDFSRDGVRRSIEASLRRLGLDRVDIVYLHDPEDYMDIALREAIPALVELREEGVIRAIGAGMNFVAPLRRFVAESDVDAVMVAGRWTLADRSAAPLLRECEGRGVAVVAAAPFNSGLLSQPRPPDDAYFDYLPASPEMLGLARALADVCTKRGIQLPHAAIQFPLLDPAVVTVVTGMRTQEQARTCAQWMRDEVSADIWAELIRTSPVASAAPPSSRSGG
jgi:D-threo-aldose 1-dehydrogenase